MALFPRRRAIGNENRPICVKAVEWLDRILAVSSHSHKRILVVGVKLSSRWSAGP